MTLNAGLQLRRLLASFDDGKWGISRDTTSSGNKRIAIRASFKRKDANEPKS
jgi:hypothetical protein